MGSRFKHLDKLVLLAISGVFIILVDHLAGWFGYGDLTATYRVSHPVYHHDLRPSVSALIRWGNRRYQITTNSLGFRDGRTRDVAPESGRRRILLMGDSFTEGLGVSWRRSFAGRLAAVAGYDAHVLNAGVVGYSPRIYLLKTQYLLDTEGLDFDELVVFIDMSDVGNEVVYAEWEPRDPDSGISPPPDFWKRFRGRSMVRRSLDFWYEHEQKDVEWNFHGVPFADDLNAVALQDPDFYSGEHWGMAPRYAERGIDLAIAHMSSLADLCAQRDIPLTLVIYPWPANILAGELDHPQVDLWRDFAEARSLLFVNLFPVFILNGMDPQETVDRYFIPGDVHWNKDGNALIAAELAPILSLSVN